MGVLRDTTIQAVREWAEYRNYQTHFQFHKIGGYSMKTIYVDVMRNGFFVKTLPYRHHEVMRLDEEKLRAFVLQKLPTLKGKEFDLFYD